MLEIIYYRVPNGIYLAEKTFNWSERKILNKTYIYNGKDFVGTHSKSWFFLKGESELKTIQVSKAPPSELTGFILRDDSLESDTIPLEFSKEQVQIEYDSDMCEYFWGNKNSLRPLYKEVYHQPAKYLENVEFEAEYLGELSIEPAEYSVDDRYSVPVHVHPDYKHKGTKEIDLSAITRYDELEKMLTPEFLLCTRPCHITSKQSYEIIRQYVKDNINSKMAAITSDYDFCFTVKKKINIKPYTQTWEEKKKNGGSYARPKMHSKEISHIQREIFEMTNEKDNYKNYTPISGFKGCSLPDLAENIKLYLDELIYFINAPVSECEHCSGTGHNIQEHNA